MIVPIHKPTGLTSHDVVNRVRRITGERRVGHAGTLDPMAEGVLVIGIGRQSTKLLGQLMLGRKVYEAEIFLGATSTTDDGEGIITEAGSMNLEAGSMKLEAVLRQFVGTIEQVPPIYSAIKKKGVPAYKLARQGKNVDLGTRTVTIDDIRLIDYEWPKLMIEVDCQKGVYIRSLARDIGQTLGTGGYLTKLVRTRVGEFTLEQAQTLEEFQSRITQDAESGTEQSKPPEHNPQSE